MYIIAKRFNPFTKKYSVAKRKLATIASTGKIEEKDGNLVLVWNWQCKIGRNDLSVWPIDSYGISDAEANRRVANIKHDFKADGYEYQPALDYENRNS